MAELIIYENGTQSEPRVFELYTNRILVGSSEDNHLILSAELVAHVHISLEFRQNGWILQDLGSEHGTTVNGEVVEEPLHLQDADAIQIGEVQLEFHTASTSVPEPTREIGEAEDEMSGRWWFTQVALITFSIIFLIVLAMLMLGVPLPLF